MQYWALQSYMFADWIVKFHIGIFRESIPMCLFQAPETKLEIIFKNFHPWRYKLSFNCASSQSERMQLVWKQHAIVVFDTCQFINATSFLQLNTDALYMVTLNLYETKAP